MARTYYKPNTQRVIDMMNQNVKDAGGEYSQKGAAAWRRAIVPPINVVHAGRCTGGANCRRPGGR